MEVQEFVPKMIRLVFCFSAILLSTSALAQNPAVTPVAATATVTSTVPTEVAQFQKLEDSWSESVNDRDQYSLELVLSPLFVDVSANGDVTTRNQQVADLIGNEDKTLHLDQKVVTVRMLGDTAVANGTYVLHHKTPSGVVDEKGVFTHVFERVHNGWVCINSQRTSLRSDAPGKQKRQSSAELPFHIPLFSRSEKNSEQ
jgi:ketosteroid isomerase-like protein